MKTGADPVTIENEMLLGAAMVAAGGSGTQ
jgi:hypothetical protein